MTLAPNLTRHLEITLYILMRYDLPRIFLETRQRDIERRGHIVSALQKIGIRNTAFRNPVFGKADVLDICGLVKIDVHLECKRVNISCARLAFRSYGKNHLGQARIRYVILYTALQRKHDRREHRNRDQEYSFAKYRHKSYRLTAMPKLILNMLKRKFAPEEKLLPAGSSFSFCFSLRK